MEIIELAKKAASAADDKKAERVLILDLAKLTSFTDYFIIAEATSERQAQAIAQNIIDELKEFSKRPMGIEGMEEGSWVLLDYGDFIVHVFLDTARPYYDLEGFWKDAEQIKWQ